MNPVSHPLDPWAAHLRTRWGLALSAATSISPLHLVATTPDGLVLSFSGAGTALRLRLLAPAALRSVTVRPDCDCGEHHGDRVVRRLELDPFAGALWEHRVDGRRRHGWTSIEAARLGVADASAYLDALLRAHAPALAAHGWPTQLRDAA